MTNAPLTAGDLCTRNTVTAVVAKDVDIRTLKVHDVMSADPVTVREVDSLMDTLELMRRHGVRRVPVIGERGALQGVLSLDDIMQVIGEEVRVNV